MKQKLDMLVHTNEQLNHQNHLLKVTTSSDSTLPEMQPGQFVQILVEKSPNTFLRRPISVHFVDETKNEFWLLVQKAGDGTNRICETKSGETLDIILPLGNSFSLPEEKNAKLLLVGGGVGIAPMLFLGKKAKENGFEPHFLLGGRSECDLLQLDEFEKYGTLHITTEDGSAGEKGFVTHHSVLKNDFDFIYTCGPKPMMMSVAKYARERNIECEVSLENLMACGFGACLCCVEKTTRGNVCACTEGAVFNIKELVNWDFNL
jgi:dihydroorotate dehydrogenase electron transfer subunit